MAGPNASAAAQLTAGKATLVTAPTATMVTAVAPTATAQIDAVPDLPERRRGGKQSALYWKAVA